MEDQLAADMHGPEEIGWLFETVAGDLPEEGGVFFSGFLLGYRGGKKKEAEHGSQHTEPNWG